MGQKQTLIICITMLIVSIIMSTDLGIVGGAFNDTVVNRVLSMTQYHRDDKARKSGIDLIQM